MLAYGNTTTHGFPTEEFGDDITAPLKINIIVIPAFFWRESRRYRKLTPKFGREESFQSQSDARLSYKSFQSGLCFSISLIFHALFHFFSNFSLAMAL